MSATRATMSVQEYSRESNVEALLNGLQNSLILGAADERDAKTLGTEATSTADAVKIGVRLVRHVVVDSDVNTLNVNTTTKDVS
jgi:hypothetical protein